MASNLAGGQCLAQHSVCVIRAAQLRADCEQLGGADSGWVSLGLITLTDSPEFGDDFTLEPESGCGRKLFTYNEPGKIVRRNLSGDLGYHDWEMMKLLFGGTLKLGAAGAYAGKVIGWESPLPTDVTAPSVYVEVITKNISASQGDCSALTGASAYPPYQGHIYPKVAFRPGDRTYERDTSNVSFTGIASVGSTSMGTGPWGDNPASTQIGPSIYSTVGYSQAQYDAIAAVAGCGYAPSLPTNP